MVMTFEVLRFEAVPAAAGVAVLELDGRFAPGMPVAERPRVLVETLRGSQELPAVEVVRDPWAATFAVPLDALGDPDTTFALVPGRGPLIALPAPTLVSADDDRFVRLARTVNDLRHRLTQAASRAAAAERRRDETAGQRDRVVAELHAARARVTELERRAAEAEQLAAANGARAEQTARETEEVRDDLVRARLEVGRLTERAADAEQDAVEAQQAVAEAERTVAEAEQARDAAEQARAQAEQAREAAELERQQAEHAREQAEHGAAEAGGVLRALRTRIEELEDERERLSIEIRDARPEAPADRGDDATTGVLPHAEDADEPDADGDADDADREPPTAPHAAPSAGARRWDRDADFEPEAATAPTRTLELDAEDLDAGPPEDEPRESVRVLRSRTPGARTSAPVRRPVPRASATGAGAEDPAVVGARSISSTAPQGLTPARLVVGGAVLLLFLALLIIFLSV